MKVAIAVLLLSLSSLTALAQAPPTLRIVTEVPNLPSELFYGNIKVKPLRLRPGTNTPITINDTDFFVHQQYVDFLSRLAEPAGFAFWQNEITSCAPACVDTKRVHVAAAFFLSIEFQQTGFFVYKTHKAAFGNLQGAPVPVRRESFMPEVRTIGNGIQVGVGNWEADLNNNKNAFTLAFVQRQEFLNQYPTGMSADAFVTQLDTRAAADDDPNTPATVLSATEKSSLVAMLGATPSNATTRAAVLRAVAENATLNQREFDKAFVLMQYFGFLQRNPNDSPDTNYDGWAFWYNKLHNQHAGNYETAEMVKAFILAIEYGNRF
jgi:hypothetical protein